MRGHLRHRGGHATPLRSLRREVTPFTVDEVVRLLDAAYDIDPAFGTYQWVTSAMHAAAESGRELRLRSVVAIDASPAQRDQVLRVPAVRARAPTSRSGV